MKRIEFIDSLKGFAILLVLWGHSIQYLCSSIDFFQNFIFKIIYSFHMPLFFLISGFFFHSSLKLHFKDFCLKKTIQLLLPCFTWSVLIVGLGIINSCYSGECDYHWLQIIKTFFTHFRSEFWFLFKLFISFFITYVFYTLFNRWWFVFILGILFVMLMPYSEFDYQRFLLPFLFAGIVIRNQYQFVRNYLKYFLIISGTIFGICLLLWNGHNVIYMTDFPAMIDYNTFTFNFSNIDISLFRLLIGLSGSVFFFTLFHIYYKRNRFFLQLAEIGKYTMGIYILQVIIFKYWFVKMFSLTVINIWVYNLLYTTVMSLFLLVVCIAVIKLLARNKYLDFLLFGDTYYNKS